MSLLLLLLPNQLLPDGVTVATVDATDSTAAFINNAVSVTVATTDAVDTSQAFVTVAAASQSASGMSRVFWENYYTQAWKKPVLAKAEIVVPATMAKKQIIVAAPKPTVDTQAALTAQASVFVAGLFKENAINIAAELALIESVPLRTQELIEDEELLLMAMVL